MFMKLVNALTVAGLFVTGSYAKCLSEEFLCCSGSNVEVQYADNTGSWGIENGIRCLIKQDESTNEVLHPANQSSSNDVIYGDTFDSMFFGAWVGGDEVLPEYPQPNAKNVAAFEAVQGRHLDIIHHFVIWQYNDWEWTRNYLDVAKANGSLMMITWMPTPYTAQDILDGKGDEYIDTFVKGIKSYGEEIWLRPLHESNGDWYTWCTGKDNINNAEEKVAAAFRYLVEKFREGNVNNVKWVWTTNNGNSGEGTTLTGSYPGDDFVDYISIDGYNFGTAQSWSSWSTFEEVFRDAYDAIAKFQKPMFIAEFSSSELGGNKAEWISEMFRILPERFPRIIGLVWFSESKPDNEGDWAINTSEAAVEAWKKGMNAYPQANRKNSNNSIEKPVETNEVATAAPVESAVAPVIKGDTFDSMFFGAWVGGDEVLPEYPQPNAKNVAAFEAVQGRHLDIIHHFVIWQYNDWEWTRNYLDVAKANGSLMMITWMPTPYTAQDILDGKGDEYIDTFVKGIKSYGEEIWLRPLHESNGDWYTWCTGKDNINNAEEKVAAAFRYLVEKFREGNVTNVKWIWTTNNGNSGEGTTLTGSYPGDDFVDYISIDGYNFGTAQSWSSWSTFEEVFRDAYDAIAKFQKPMFIAEFSSSELGGNKAEWISEMFRILPERFPRIIGLVWFSESKPDNEGDWAINTSEAAVEAWKKGMSAYPPAKRIGSNENHDNKLAMKEECWSEKFGYKCCSPENKVVIETDENGKWGTENGNWCGIF